MAPKSAGNKPLIVGIYKAPPFCIKLPNGRWSGLSVELWEAIARQAKLSYAFQEMPLEAILQKVGNREIDAGVGPISLTPEREEILDFTHPYYVSDLAIAVPRRSYFFPWNEIAAEFFNFAWLKLIAVLVFMLLISGFCVWRLERKRNPSHFGGNWHHGLGSGFWWAAVTMSGVGYGDKTPVTAGGRLIALAWMFISIITVALVTASATSAAVAMRDSYHIRSPRDLGRAHVAVVSGSTAEQYANLISLDASLYPNIRNCVEALLKKQADACIGDETELRYLATKDHPHRLDILPFTFHREACGFVLQSGSPLLEPLNHVLLQEMQGDAWRSLRRRYLGE